jgi:uncharacterized protein
MKFRRARLLLHLLNILMKQANEYHIIAAGSLLGLAINRGLLSMRMSLNPDAVIQNIGLSDKANGMLAENYAAQELTAMEKPLYYWSSGNSAEIDFVIQDDSLHSVIPLEVKSADNVKAKSLKVYTALYNPAYTVKISAGNFGFENNMKSIPLYALFTLSGNE